MDDNYDEASVPLELETKENLLSLLEKKDDDLRVAGEIGRQLLEKNQMLERELEVAHDARKEAESTAEEYLARVKHMETQRDEIVSRVETVMQEADEARSEVEKWRSTAIQASQEMEKIHQYKDKYEELQLQEESLKQTIEQLQVSVDRQARERAVAQSDSSNEEQELQQKDEEIGKLKEKLAALHQTNKKALERIASLQDELERTHELEAERDRLESAMNSLVKANKHIQDEQEEYRSLLNHAREQISVLEESRNNGDFHALPQHSSSLDMELNAVEEKPKMVLVDRGTSPVKTTLHHVGVNTDSPPMVCTGVQTDYVHIVGDEEIANENHFKEANSELQNRLAQADAERSRLERALRDTEDDLQKKIQLLTQELAELTARAEEMHSRAEKLDTMRKERLDRMIEVLEQVWDLRERLTNASESVRSSSMRKVLRPEEVINVSDTVVNSVLNDTKKRLNKEGEMKLYGKSEEWVCQIFELLVQQAELLKKQNALVLSLRACRKKGESPVANRGRGRGRGSPGASPSPAASQRRSSLDRDTGQDSDKEETKWWKFWGN